MKTPAQPDSSEVAGADRWRILAVLLGVIFMTLIGVSIVNVALPSIQKGLGADQSDLQWVLSGYALTFGVILVAAGRAGDIMGRGGIFLLGVGIFTASSIAAGFAPDAMWLNTAGWVPDRGWRRRARLAPDIPGERSHRNRCYRPGVEVVPQAPFPPPPGIRTGQNGSGCRLAALAGSDRLGAAWTCGSGRTLSVHGIPWLDHFVGAAAGRGRAGLAVGGMGTA